jgi:phosphotransferase system HPr (HPr) family protein
MRTVQLPVLHEAGLHARTAALFSAQAARFASAIRVRNATRGSTWADAKSILSVLALGVEQGHDVEICAEGPDEELAAAALEEFIRSGFAGMG